MILGLFFIALFMGSTQAVSIYAPDQLVLIPGSYSSGNTKIDFSSFNILNVYLEYDTIIKVVDILDYPDVSKSLVRFRIVLDIISFPVTDPFANDLVYEYDYLIWEHNRTIAVPMYYIKITNGTTIVQASLMGENTFAGVSDLSNMKVTLSDGREFLWDDFIGISSLETEAVVLGNFIMEQWTMGSNLPSKEQNAISPEAAIGQKVDYGWYEGDVVETSTLTVGGTTHEIIKVHINQTESDPIPIGDDSTVIMHISESDFLYEAKTGLIAGFYQYNETGYAYARYIADEIKISESSTSGNTLTLPYDYLFGILGLGFMISLVLIHKMKK